MLLLFLYIHPLWPKASFEDDLKNSPYVLNKPLMQMSELLNIIGRLIISKYCHKLTKLIIKFTAFLPP